MPTDEELWREALDFRVEECLGFWSKFAVTFPFGRVIELHPNDGPCIMMDGNLEGRRPEEVLFEVETFFARLGLRCGFQFSSAWSGDVNAFRAHLIVNGYQPVFDANWVIKEDFSDVDNIPESELIIDLSPDSATVKDLFRKTINSSEDVAERLKRRLDRGGSIEVSYAVARTRNGDPVAFSGYSQRGAICHFQTMGTLKEHRRSGAARHMARVHHQLMRDRGIKWAFAFVAKQNVPSFEYTKQLGFRVFQETSLWTKRAG